MKTILVVDDERDMRKFMSAILTAEGYTVLTAEDGLQALEMIRTKRPDLVISDVMMENLNGFMLLENLREDPATTNTPVILVTGAAQNAGAWQADTNVDYLMKPVSAKELIGAIKKRIPR